MFISLHCIFSGFWVGAFAGEERVFGRLVFLLLFPRCFSFCSLFAIVFCRSCIFVYGVDALGGCLTVRPNLGDSMFY